MSMPKIVVLCGSSRFCDIMAVCAWFLERDEGVMTMGLHLLPGWYCDEHIDGHLAEHEGVADHMDELHLRKIDLADEVFVVDAAGYIGESTRNEIRYATERGIPIRLYSSDPIGDQVRRLLDAFLKTHKEHDMNERNDQTPERCPRCDSDQLDVRHVATGGEHFRPPLPVCLYDREIPGRDPRRLVAVLCLDCDEVRFKGREQL